VPSWCAVDECRGNFAAAWFCRCALHGRRHRGVERDGGSRSAAVLTFVVHASAWLVVQALACFADEPWDIENDPCAKPPEGGITSHAEACTTNLAPCRRVIPHRPIPKCSGDEQQ